MVVRKRRFNNKVTRLRKENGEWTNAYEELEKMASDFFMNLYRQGSSHDHAHCKRALGC